MLGKYFWNWSYSVKSRNGKFSQSGNWNGIPMAFLSAQSLWRYVPCLISLKIWIRHILKKFILNNIKSSFLHLYILILEKSLALRRRTKLSARPLIYHISVSGKLSLYLFLASTKRKFNKPFH